MEINVNEEIKKAVKEHLFFCTKDDVVQTINFVADLMDIYRTHTLQTEPHATRSINGMTKAIYHIQSLEDFYNEHISDSE